MINVGDILLTLWNQSGFAALFSGFGAGGWQNLVMLIIACVLLYLAIVKKFEPLLLVGIAFGCLLSNLPNAGLYHPELWTQFMAHEIGYGTVMLEGGLLDIFYIGVKSSLYPCLTLAPCCLTPRACCWVQLLRWAFSQHSSAQFCWASPVPRLLPSASSAALTAPPQFT